MGCCNATQTNGNQAMQNQVFKTLDTVVTSLFNTVVLAGLPLVAATLVIGSFAS